MSTRPTEYRPQRRRLPPGEKPPLRVQERDFQILEAILTNRFLTRSLLVPLFPSDPTRAVRETTSGDHRGTNIDRRLAKLFHHGFLDRIRTVRGGELIYALGQRGAELLKTQQPELPLAGDWAEKNRDLSTYYLEHALMVARFRTALLVALRQLPGTEIETFQREHQDLRARWTNRGQTFSVNPDGFFQLRDATRPEGKQRSAFFLEADRSTMSLERLEAKYHAYARLYADRQHQESFGVPSFRVLTVTKSPERASNLLKLVASSEKVALADLRAFFLFTTEESYRHPEQLANVLAAIWRRADQPQDLCSLVSSPLPRM